MTEVAALELDDERLVHARLVDVVLEAEGLQDVERVRGVPHPIGVPADRPLAGHLHDRLDAVGDELPLLITIEEIAVAVDDAGRRDTVATQGRQEGQCAPAPVRHLGNETAAAGTAPCRRVMLVLAQV